MTARWLGLDETSIAGALDDAPMMGGDGGIDQVASQPPKARQRAILVGAGEPAVADNIGDQNRRELPGLAHPSGTLAICMPARTRSR